MLHFTERNPTDDFTSPNGGHYTIKKDGTEINDSHIRTVIDEMIAKRLVLDKACTIDPFPARHSASFITGTSNWREKGVIWGELDPGGTGGMLLWASC